VATLDGSFSVLAGELAAGSAPVRGLQDRCTSVGGSAADALASMAGAAGYPDLVSALTGAADSGMRAFLNAGAVYAHVAQGLSQNAGSYAQAESTIVGRIQALCGPR
jgi:hypothetical protein